MSEIALTLKEVAQEILALPAWPRFRAKVRQAFLEQLAGYPARAVGHSSRHTKQRPGVRKYQKDADDEDRRYWRVLEAEEVPHIAADIGGWFRSQMKLRIDALLAAGRLSRDFASHWIKDTVTVTSIWKALVSDLTNNTVAYRMEAQLRWGHRPLLGTFTVRVGDTFEMYQHDPQHGPIRSLSGETGYSFDTRTESQNEGKGGEASIAPSRTSEFASLTAQVEDTASTLWSKWESTASVRSELGRVGSKISAFLRSRLWGNMGCHIGHETVRDMVPSLRERQNMQFL